MSSIDKSIESIARSYDSRVYMRNSSISKGAGGCHGQIRLYIGNECILTLDDRYGILNEDEKDMIRRAITQYQARERQNAEEEARRRAEEARKRAEEEARRREAERVAAGRNLIAAAGSASLRLQSSLSTAREEHLKLQARLVEMRDSLASAKFQVPALQARVEGLINEQNAAYERLGAEAAEKERSLSAVKAAAPTQSTEWCRARLGEISSGFTILSSASFRQQEITELRSYVLRLTSLQNTLYEQRRMFARAAQSGGLSGEIATVALSEIDKADKSSIEQIEGLLTKLNKAQTAMRESDDREAVYKIEQELKSATVVTQASESFVLRGSTYENIDYASQCEKAEATLRTLYESLLSKSASTATKGEIEAIGQVLQQYSVGSATKNLLDSLLSVTDLVRIILTDDRENAELLSEYSRIKEETEAYGGFVEELDVENYQAQRERLLDGLFTLKVKAEREAKKQEIEAKRSMLSFHVRMAFAENGVYFITGRLSEEESAEELIFAMPGVDDVVFKVTVTEDSFSWSVCGVKREDGTVASAERVLEVMRVFDEKDIPQKIMQAVSQSLDVRSAEVTVNIDSFSDNALQSIVDNGTFSLSGQLFSEDGTVHTVGEVIKNMSAEFAEQAEQNKLDYAVGTQTSHTQIAEKAEDDFANVDVQLLRKKMREERNASPTYKKKQESAHINAKRYMYKK